MGWYKMIWLGKKGSRRCLLEIGLSLNDWAVPLSVSAIQPYTTQNDPERWAKEVTVTLFCFYFSLTW
jgi:hypothetical protein